MTAMDADSWARSLVVLLWGGKGSRRRGGRPACSDPRVWQVLHPSLHPASRAEGRSRRGQTRTKLSRHGADPAPVRAGEGERTVASRGLSGSRRISMTRSPRSPRRAGTWSRRRLPDTGPKRRRCHLGGRTMTLARVALYITPGQFSACERPDARGGVWRRCDVAGVDKPRVLAQLGSVAGASAMPSPYSATVRSLHDQTNLAWLGQRGQRRRV